jgi:hypothetical protein
MNVSSAESSGSVLLAIRFQELKFPLSGCVEFTAATGDVDVVRST